MKDKHYNTEALLAMGGGNQTFVTKMCEIFLQVVPEGLEKIKEGWRERDVKKIFQYAHKIKSNINHLSVEAAKDDLKQIEMMTREGNLDETLLPIWIERVSIVVEQAIKEIKEDFNL